MRFCYNDFKLWTALVVRLDSCKDCAHQGYHVIRENQLQPPQTLRSDSVNGRRETQAVWFGFTQISSGRGPAAYKQWHAVVAIVVPALQAAATLQFLIDCWTCVALMCTREGIWFSSSTRLRVFLSQLLTNGTVPLLRLIC